MRCPTIAFFFLRGGDGGGGIYYNILEVSFLCVIYTVSFCQHCQTPSSFMLEHPPKPNGSSCLYRFGMCPSSSFTDLTISLLLLCYFSCKLFGCRGGGGGVAAGALPYPAEQRRRRDGFGVADHQHQRRDQAEPRLLLLSFRALTDRLSDRHARTLSIDR